MTAKSETVGVVASELSARMTEYAASNYIPVPESGCWLWLGSWDNWGYGKLGRRGLNFIATHRLFYAFHKGPIPDGLLVCHKCDTPACVNPEHLFLGTHQDNCDDKIAKGRHKIRRPKPPKNIHKVSGKIPYRGVVENSPGRYKVTIEAFGKRHNIGAFGCVLEAAHAYNRAAVRLRGTQAILNPIGEP